MQKIRQRKGREGGERELEEARQVGSLESVQNVDVDQVDAEADEVSDRHGEAYRAIEGIGAQGEEEKDDCRASAVSPGDAVAPPTRSEARAAGR